MIQTREQRIAQLTREYEQRQTKAKAYIALSEIIRESPVPVHAYGPHWRAVAAVLSEDATQLALKAQEIQQRISNLERARDAAENWTPPTIDQQLRQSVPTVTTVGSLLADDYATEIRDAGI